MTRTRMLVAAIGTVLAAAAALAWWQRVPIGMALMAREIDARATVTDPLAALPDGLHVGLCGTGSPMPDERRAGPCTVVVAGQRMFVIDAGAAAARNIVLMRLNVGQVEALLLTHYHSDHIDGVGEMLLQRWVQRTAMEPLPVYGPQGLEQVIDGFTRAYTPDRGYRIAHHGQDVLPPPGFGAQPRPFVIAAGERKVLVSEPDLEIVAFAVEHEPVHGAVGYRIRYKDRSIVVSGDTRRSDAVLRESKGADLLLHEALSPAMSGMFRSSFDKVGRQSIAKVFHDILDYHTSPQQAAEIAQAAGVRMLVLHHIIPVLPPGFEDVFLENTQAIYRGPVHVGVDGDWFTLPAGSAKIEVGRRP